jgi:saccharopepsin
MLARSKPRPRLMKDEKLMSESISRRSFLKSVASLAAMIGFFPVSLLSGCSGDSANGKSDPRGYLFPLTKGPLMDNGATPWYATLFLGTPGQAMTVMMDTGTANTWVTSSLCSTEACSTKQYKYDPTLSTTHSKVPGATWQHNDLGAWGEFESLSGKDYMGFIDPDRGDIDLWIKLQSAILEDASGSTNWKDLDMCGGVGFPVIFDAPDAVNNPESLLPIMLNQGLISNQLVSFWIDGDNGGCIVGGTDPSRYDSNTLNELPLTSVADNLNLWTVELEQIQRNSAPLLDGPINLALDTGSSRFKGSPVLIEHLIDRITTKPDGEKLPTTFSDPSLVQEFPCLTLEINGHRYTLQPEDYIWKIENSGLFSLQFHPLDLGDENTILVGSVFLDHVYSVFQYVAAPMAPYGYRGIRIYLYDKP